MVALILDQPVPDEAIEGMIAHADLSNCVQIRLREYVDPNFRVQSSNQQGIVYGSNKPMVITTTTHQQHPQTHFLYALCTYSSIYTRSIKPSLHRIHSFTYQHPSTHHHHQHHHHNPHMCVLATPNSLPVPAKNAPATTSPTCASTPSAAPTDRNWAKLA